MILRLSTGYVVTTPTPTPVTTTVDVLSLLGQKIISEFLSLEWFIHYSSNNDIDIDICIITYVVRAGKDNYTEKGSTWEGEYLILRVEGEVCHQEFHSPCIEIILSCNLAS